MRLGLRFVPFPGPSSSGDQVLGERTVPGGRCVSSPPGSQPLGFLCAPREHRLRCVVCVSSAGLISGFDPPGGWQLSRISEDLVSNWEPAHSLVEDAPRLLALPVAHLPLCLWQGDGPVCSQLALLWYSLNPLFCEPARLCLRLELFMGKFSLALTLSLSFLFSLFLSLSLAIPQFGLLSQDSSFRLSSGHSGPVLTLSMQPTPPPLTGGRCKRLGYFSTGSFG